MRIILLILILLSPVLKDRTASADNLVVDPQNPVHQENDRVAQIVLARCPMEYDRVTTLGAHLTGGGAASKLQELSIRRGDRVKAGQVIGHLYDDELRIEWKRLKAQADSDVGIRLAESRVVMRASKLSHSRALRRKNLLSDEDMELHQFDLTEAERALEQERFNRLLAIHDRDRVEAEIRARELVSPHNGVVVEVLKNPGESLSPNEPIVQIVDVDLIRVSSAIDASDSWRVKVGQPVRITPDLNGSAPEIEGQQFPGKIVFVDSRIDQATQTCRIMAEVINRNTVLRSGLECRMIVYLEKGDTAPYPDTPATDPLKTADTTKPFRQSALIPSPRIVGLPSNSNLDPNSGVDLLRVTTPATPKVARPTPVTDPRRPH